jgi:uncharacterized protein YkwD
MPRKTQILVGLAAGFCALLTASGGLAQSRSRAETGLLRAVNATRTAHGLRPLSLDAALTRAARAHSVEMLRGDYFAHGNFQARMIAFHVRGAFAGENLAWGSGSFAAPSAVIAEWLRSPEHRANLLRPSFARIGIGVVTTTGQGSFLGATGATVMTADFTGS